MTEYKKLEWIKREMESVNSDIKVISNDLNIMKEEQKELELKSALEKSARRILYGL
ncbi:hypothetical protein [Marinobacter salarius]|uniref:hypothetical protein n=1 Tax=Marinobacter salarius TaxID=1420917 RepID=UPI003BA94FC7